MQLSQLVRRQSAEWGGRIPPLPKCSMVPVATVECVSMASATARTAGRVPPVSSTAATPTRVATAAPAAPSPRAARAFPVGMARPAAPRSAATDSSVLPWERLAMTATPRTATAAQLLAKLKSSRRPRRQDKAIHWPYARSRHETLFAPLSCVHTCHGCSLQLHRVWLGASGTVL